MPGRAFKTVVVPAEDVSELERGTRLGRVARILLRGPPKEAKEDPVKHEDADDEAASGLG